jgi:uncharacterized membrane protein YhaH (DUF805 family)
MQLRGLGAAATVACALGIPTLLQAQRSDASGAAGCAACSGCGGLFILVWLGLIGLQIALWVWVARDAKARGMDSAILWMLLVVFVPLLGIVVYLFARPQGNMVQCPNCGNRRLQASVKCPHCGIGS